MNNIYYSLIAIFFILLSSCGSGKRTPLEGLIELNGNKYQGGTFKYNEPEPFKTLFIHDITEVVGARIATQIYEGLYTLDQQSLEVKPCLAENVTIDSSNYQHVYTFKIKDNVYFHDDDCFPEGKGRKCEKIYYK